MGVLDLATTRTLRPFGLRSHVFHSVPTGVNNPSSEIESLAGSQDGEGLTGRWSDCCVFKEVGDCLEAVGEFIEVVTHSVVSGRLTIELKASGEMPIKNSTSGS